MDERGRLSFHKVKDEALMSRIRVRPSEVLQSLITDTLSMLLCFPKRRGMGLLVGRLQNRVVKEMLVRQPTPPGIPIVKGRGRERGGEKESEGEEYSNVRRI